MKKARPSKNLFGFASLPEPQKPDGKATLTPKLRFPEFRGAEGWEVKKLSRIVELVSGMHLSPEQYGKEGAVPYFTGPSDFTNNIEAITKRTIESASLAKEDDSLITVKGSGVGEIWYLTLSSVAMGRQLMAVRAIDAASRFVFQFLLTKRQRFGDLAAGNLIPGLSRGDILDLEGPFPPIPEQQKIAECLSSVDELIAAEARKLDALKTHKKGLMQQLFPREGETQPRLRFPEFQNAGEWEEKSLDYLCDRIMDGTHFSPQTKVGPRPYLTSKNIKSGKIDLSNLSYISEEEHSEIYKRCPVKVRDVLLTKDGANTGNCALNDLDFEFSLLSSVAVLRGNPVVLMQDFLFQSILSDRTQALIAESMSGQAITRITLTKIGGFSIPVTTVNEQQRIADCLTSLDDLITAQTQKLSALKAHKKALMQQLFPSAEN